MGKSPAVFELPCTRMGPSRQTATGRELSFHRRMVRLLSRLVKFPPVRRHQNIRRPIPRLVFPGEIPEKLHLKVPRSRGGVPVKTTATNKRIRELLTEIRDGTLIPRPEFQ